MYDTQSFNRYSYVRNNPLKYIDPSGHSWLSKNWNNAKSWSKNHKKEIAIVAAVVLIVAGGGVLLAISLEASVVSSMTAALGISTTTLASISGSVLFTGLTLAKSASDYNPDEPESPTNQLSASTHVNIPIGGDSGYNTSDLIYTGASGTNSNYIGGNSVNGAYSVTYAYTVDPTYNRNENVYVATQLNVDIADTSSISAIQSIHCV